MTTKHTKTTKTTPAKTLPAKTTPTATTSDVVDVVVADQETAALATMDLFDTMAADGATYAPEFSTEDRAINFLRIAQAMSPAAKKLDPTYIPGCAEGSFYTSITRRVAETVLFLPAYWTKNYTWWKPRNAGGGLVKNFGSDKVAAQVVAAARNPDTGRLELRNAVPGVPVVEVVEADLYFGFWLTDEGTTEECVLSLTSTQLPKARRWNSVINGMRHPKSGAPLPLFARAYQLSTVGEQNDRGSWAGLAVAPGPLINELSTRWDVLYAMAKGLADDCRRGVRVEVADADVVPVTEEADAAMGDDDDYLVDDDIEDVGHIAAEADDDVVV